MKTTSNLSNLLNKTYSTKTPKANLSKQTEQNIPNQTFQSNKIKVPKLNFNLSNPTKVVVVVVVIIVVVFVKRKLGPKSFDLKTIHAHKT